MCIRDRNTANQSQLEELPGVGPVMAGKILAWRSEHGRFSRVAELQEIDGVGPKTYAKLAPLCLSLIHISEPTPY